MTEPTNNQPTNNQPTPEETTKFDTWFQDYVRRHEVQSGSSTQSNVSQNEGTQSQGRETSNNLESLIETVMNRREQRQSSEKRLKDLEASNTDLGTKIADLTKRLSEKPKRTWKDAFSIFS